jgi:translation initiation factor 1 (eIF-1/SUI1)
VEDIVKPLPDFMPVVDGAREADAVAAAKAKDGAAPVVLPPMPEGTDVVSMNKGKVRVFGTDIPTKNIGFRPQELVLVLGRYVRANQLYHPTDPSSVLLDEVLGKGLFKGASRRVLKDLGIEFAGGGKGYPPSITKAQLGKLAIQRCGPWHLLSYSNGDQVAARGAAPRITVVRASVPNRKNKASTIIRGLEYFGVDPSAVASSAATKFACSTTVQEEEAEEKTAKEVMMQGDCCERVPDFLVDKFKIPARFIDVDDSGGPKKSKGPREARGGKGGKKRR